MGSAQRLPNGNTLICESIAGYFFEIDDNNQKVWEYVNPQKTNGDIISQGDNPESNLIFRAFKYDPNYSAFIGKDMTPNDPIELNFETNVPCTILSVKDLIFRDLVIYPNPTQNTINIKSINPIDKIELYNGLGAKIIQTQNGNIMDVAELSPGMYILKIYSKNSSITKKIIKI
jgi:hypothetical protein